MKTRIIAMLATAALAVGLAGPGHASTTTLTLDGVRVALPAGAREVITARHTGGIHARVTLWRFLDGRWVARIRSANGRIGYGGLVAGDKRHQGSGTTPTGTYPLLFTFGLAPHRRAWRMPYRRVRSTSYWVEDNGSAYYNRWRDRSQGGFRWWLNPNSTNGSERLGSYPRQYRMVVVIGYNYTKPVHYRGAGIFLHVNGSGATAGCVSAPRWFLAQTLARLQPGLRPVIAIG